MPITAITGLPGNGKTLHTLELVQARVASDLKEARKSDPTAEPRPVHYFGINEVTLEGWTEFAAIEEWPELPNGALIVIDEAQEQFPRVPESRAQKMPHYAFFARHRHKGFDMFLVTQDPARLDGSVSAMVETHVHMVRVFGGEGAIRYEWKGVQKVFGRDLSKDKVAIKSQWKHPKELYGAYKSAEIHTVKRRLPVRKLLTVALTILAAIGMFWYAVSGIFSKGGPTAEELEAEATAAAGEAPGATGSVRSTGSTFSLPGGGVGAVIEPAHWAEPEVAFAPRVPDLPLSAPAYDHLTDIREAPKVDGCMSMNFGDGIEDSLCQCNDQRGNVIPVSTDACLAFVDRGWFDPTIATPRAARPARRADPASDAGGASPS